jgi:hypothetical protein
MQTPEGTKREADVAPLEAKINKMASLASRLAEVGDDIQDFPVRNAARTWNTQLAQLITGYLESGRDDALTRALDSLVSPAMEPTGSWNTLRDYIRTYASWELGENLSAESPHEYFLCSIPVFLGPQRPRAYPDDLAGLEAVLSQSGLVGVGAQVTLVPCGLVPAELLSSLSFSQVKQLTQLLTHCNRIGQWRLVRDFIVARMSRLDRTVPPTNLYSLLVLYRTEDRTQPFMYDSLSADVLNAGFESAEAVHEALCADWRRAAERHLCEALGLPLEHVHVGDPQPYFHGLEELDEELRKRQFLLRTGAILGDQEQAYEAVRANIHPMAFCRGFTVTFERDGARVGTIEFPSFPAEPTMTALECLGEALATLDIEPLRVAQA